MASFSYSDDEDQKRGAQKDKLSAQPAPTGPTPTFAELQRRGMPRPPPMGPAAQALYGASGGSPSYGAPSAGAPPPMGATAGFSQGPERSLPGAPPQPPSRYMPTGQLDQGNLEGYLYDMLADPTASPTYKNAMRLIGGDIDVDASKRGVFHSTIPVGAYSNAGANLASGLQGAAFGQLQNYNQGYEQLLMALLGAT